MNILEFLILLLVAGICGSIAAALVGRHMSFFVLIFVGLIGAMLGRWLSGQLHMPEVFSLHVGGASIPILWTIVGSMLLVGVASLFVRRWYTS